MSSPWGKILKPEIPVSFAEIMSEDVARNIQNKENELHRKFLDIGKLDEAGPPILYDTQIDENIPDEVLKAISNDSIESDAAIAQMLQMQFDKEYDDTLRRKEQKLNGTSKVSISFENYKRAPHNFDFESDSEPEEIEDIQDRKDWDRFDTLQKVIDSIPGCGYKVQQNGTLITKHDLVNNGRKNACKLLSFPPEFQTGDGETFDLKLSNKVYNSLKKHSKKEQVRRYRTDTKKEDRATAEFGMDEYTRLLIYKMVNGGLLDSVNGVISIGKEAVIIHVDSNTDFPDVQEPLPKECVLKVFKTTLAEFKRRDQYIKGDHRFKDKIGKKTSKKNINVWVEKEMANLLRLQRVGIKCPKVVTVKKHILLMSFIGEKNRPAPKLKDAIMSDADYSIAYEEVIDNMKKLYHEANLIHADLSEYNILWFNDSCYFIDVSQSVEPTHENAYFFLHRDCSNIINFFKKKGVPNIMTADELFSDIVNCSFDDKVALTAVQESFKMKPHLVDKPGVESSFEFNSIWEKNENGELPKVNLKIQLPEVEENILSNEITCDTQNLSLVDPLTA